MSVYKTPKAEKAIQGSVVRTSERSDGQSNLKQQKEESRGDEVDVVRSDNDVG